MYKMMYRLMLVAALVILTGSQVAWAIDVPATATKDDELSAVALTKSKELLATQKEKLTKQLEADTSLDEGEKTQINMLVAKIEEQIETLVNIEVYFVEESAPGEAFDDVAGFYEGKLNNFTIVGNDELVTLLDSPVEIMPQTTKDSLEQMINDGSARAAAGTATKTRVSVMTFYMHPETFELIHRTSIVVATTK